MNTRLKELRKSLKLTLEEFGNKVGVTKAAISRLERGERAITEQMLISICREFNVNDKWLRTGEGKMFIELPEEDEFMKAAASISKSNDKFAMQMLIEYWKLDDDSKQIFTDYLKKVVKNSQK